MATATSVQNDSALSMNNNGAAQQNKHIQFGQPQNRATPSELILDIPNVDELVDKYVIKPSDIKSIWNTYKVRNKMAEFFQNYYKPKSTLDPEIVEYNTINILAEIQAFNLEFSKNKLLFDDYKTAVVLDIFWRLLEFQPQIPQQINAEEDGNENIKIDNLDKTNEFVQKNQDQLQENTQNQSSMNPAADQSTMAQSQTVENSIQYHGEGFDSQKRGFADEEFSQLLKHKFELLKSMLIEALKNPAPQLCLNKEHICRILKYAQETYFKHLRLYNFVLDGKATNEVKRVSVFENIPCIMPNLNHTLCTDNQNVVYYDEDDDDLKSTPQKSSSKKDGQSRQGSVMEEETGENQPTTAQQVDPYDDTESVASMAEDIKNATLNKKSKKVIHNRVKNWNDRLKEELANARPVDEMIKKK